MYINVFRKVNVTYEYDFNTPGRKFSLVDYIIKSLFSAIF